MDFDELVDERLERADLVKVRCYDCGVEICSGGMPLIGQKVLCSKCYSWRSIFGLQKDPRRNAGFRRSSNHGLRRS